MTLPALIMKAAEAKLLLEELVLIKHELNAIKRANVRIARALEKIAERGRFK